MNYYLKCIDNGNKLFFRISNNDNELLFRLDNKLFLKNDFPVFNREYMCITKSRIYYHFIIHTLCTKYLNIIMMWIDGSCEYKNLTECS